MIFSAEEQKQLSKCWECKMNCPAFENPPAPKDYDALREWIKRIMTEPLPCIQKEEQK